MTLSQIRLRQRIICRLRYMRDELQQTINDKESWNDNRPKEMPFDVGWDKVFLNLVNRQLDAWDRNDIDEVKAIQARINRLA